MSMIVAYNNIKGFDVSDDQSHITSRVLMSVSDRAAYNREYQKL